MAEAVTGGATPDAALVRELADARRRLERLQVRAADAHRVEAAAQGVLDRLAQAEAELAAHRARRREVIGETAAEAEDAAAVAAVQQARDACARLAELEALNAALLAENGERRRFMEEAEGRRAELRRLEAEVQSLRAQAEAHASRPADTQARLDAALAEAAALRSEFAVERARAQALERELEALRASSSWRVTGPLRAVAARLGRR